jgi:hypothetical protein
MTAPTQSEKAMLVATMAAGIMASYESWRAYGEESADGETFEQWAINRAVPLCRDIWGRCGGE